MLWTNNMITRACLKREVMQPVYGTTEYVSRIRGKPYMENKHLKLVVILRIKKNLAFELIP